MIRTFIFSLILMSTFTACNQKSSSDTVTTKVVLKDISVTEAAQLHSKGYVYIDLRTPREIENDGMIASAIAIDYRSADFEQQISKLPKSDKYIAYCASGGRSSKSLATFSKYKLEAYNMLGGYRAWKKTK